MSVGSFTKRLERLEGPKDEGPFAGWTLSQLLRFCGEHAEVMATEIEDGAKFIAGLDADEANTTAFEARPDIASAVAANVAAGLTPPVAPLPEGVRWPHLIRRHEWWETTYGR